MDVRGGNSPPVPPPLPTYGLDPLPHPPQELAGPFEGVVFRFAGLFLAGLLVSGAELAIPLVQRQLGPLARVAASRLAIPTEYRVIQKSAESEKSLS